MSQLALKIRYHSMELPLQRAEVSSHESDWWRRHEQQGLITDSLLIHFRVQAQGWEEREERGGEGREGRDGRGKGRYWLGDWLGSRVTM